MKGAAGAVRIGISGWRYKGWRGQFYPPKLPQRRELEFASREFNTIELNGSFYSLQQEASFVRWRDETPQDFVFAVKGSRYITHMLRLQRFEKPLARFLHQGILRLGAKLGPLLWQLPPNFQFDEERQELLERFFSQLPFTYAEAAQQLARYGGDLPGAGSHQLEDDLPARSIRHAIEIRHPSFACEEFIAILRKYGVALVAADSVEWPLLMDITSDFVYCRLHGREELYASGYDSRALELWAQRVCSWARGGEAADGVHASSRAAPRKKTRDVYVYFDNDAKVRAPADAKMLRSRVTELMAAR